MPKRFNALLLLITMTLGPAAGVFGDVLEVARSLHKLRYRGTFLG
jgi:hypothetical protein